MEAFLYTHTLNHSITAGGLGGIMEGKGAFNQGRWPFVETVDGVDTYQLDLLSSPTTTLHDTTNYTDEGYSKGYREKEPLRVTAIRGVGELQGMDAYTAAVAFAGSIDRRADWMPWTDMTVSQAVHIDHIDHHHKQQHTQVQQVEGQHTQVRRGLGIAIRKMLKLSKDPDIFASHGNTKHKKQDVSSDPDPQRSSKKDPRLTKEESSKSSKPGSPTFIAADDIVEEHMSIPYPIPYPFHKRVTVLHRHFHWDQKNTIATVTLSGRIQSTDSGMVGMESTRFDSGDGNKNGKKGGNNEFISWRFQSLLAYCEGIKGIEGTGVEENAKRPQDKRTSDGNAPIVPTSGIGYSRSIVPLCDLEALLSNQAPASTHTGTHTGTHTVVVELVRVLSSDSYAVFPWLGHYMRMAWLRRSIRGFEEAHRPPVPATSTSDPVPSIPGDSVDSIAIGSKGQTITLRSTRDGQHLNGVQGSGSGRLFTV